MTLGQYPGAAAGKYKVTVSKDFVETLAPANYEPGSASDTKSYSLVDAKYQLPETTPITVDISSGENKPPAIDVGAAVRLAAPTL
jgi:hypothetical protein